MIKKMTVYMASLCLLMTGLLAMGINSDDTFAAEPTQHNAHPAEQLYPIEEKGKYGFINGKGKIVIEPVHDGLGYSGRPGGAVYVEDRSAGLQIYYSSDGSRLFECRLSNCGVPSDGLILLTSKIQASGGKTATRYGFIDERGDVVIPPAYHRAYPFSNGLARVNQGKASGYINKKGELVIPYRYSETTDFSEGLAAVRLSVRGKYGYIDTRGRMVIPPRYDYATPFSDGAAVVSVNGKYGYIDKKGSFILSPQFTMAQPFSEGLALAERNGAVFYINKQGRKVIQNIKAGGLFSGGIAPASKGRTYGYINRSGKFVITSQYEWAANFSGELAEVYFRNSDSSSEMKGYIDRSGKLIWK